MGPRRRSDQVLVQRYADGAFRRAPDELIVEEPMAIQLDGHLVATTMRTPGHDFELAVGYCHTEGLLGGAAVSGCRYCGNGPIADAVGGPRARRAADTDFNVVTVETGGRAPVPQPRLAPTTSACGLCGSASLTDLQLRLEPVPPGPLRAPDPVVLAGVAEQVRRAQPLFERTGAVHAAAAFDERGQVVVVREDIGRHNAVDKVVGNLLLAGGLPAHRLGLFVSSRASFEMVQKAWAGGFGLLVAVSAPSALAVATARAASITLIGFLRGDRFVVYAPDRLP
ncbi:MAG: formate dehydrogenase accessory sulfurtransferase FdhD [Acidimicrobiia bacterium]